MASLEHFDLLIGEALECLIEAASEIKNIEIVEKKKILMKIGDIIANMWSVREILYDLNSNLKRDFVLEREQNKRRYEDLNDLFYEAHKMEIEGKGNDAIILYHKLYQVSKYGYFRLLAEAGLYRVERDCDSQNSI